MSARGTSMRRYAAFLRGVSPMNCKMPELRKSLEAAGFADVKTLLSSGNVVFGARAASETSVAKKAEAAMEEGLGHSFPVIVRTHDALAALLAADPFEPFHLAPDEKRVVTFLKEPPKGKLPLPLEVGGARILCMKGSEVFTAYVPSPREAVFMRLIEKTFGKQVTTRTWQTVEKVARASAPE